MAKQVLKNARVWVGGYNMSGRVNAVAVEHGVDAQDATDLMQDTHVNVAGLSKSALTCEGFWDASITDPVGFNNLAGSLPATIMTGLGVGAIGVLASGLVDRYSLGGAVGDVVPFSIGMDIDQGMLCRGALLQNGTVTASGNGTAVNLGTPAGSIVGATLHVLSITGTLDVVVQSSAAQAFTNPVNRITFAQAAGVGGQWAQIAVGAITDPWWRITWTLSAGGSAAFVVAAGYSYL